MSNQRKNTRDRVPVALEQPPSARNSAPRESKEANRRVPDKGPSKGSDPSGAGQGPWDSFISRITSQPLDILHVYNVQNPGLNLHRLSEGFPLKKFFGDPNPAICLQYWKRFRETEDPDVLIEFMNKHPIEFDCSGWVLTAFGYLLLGMPNRAKCETRARDLFATYWRLIKHPRLSMGQILAIVRSHLETEKFSESSPHRKHFQIAAHWLSKRLVNGGDDEFAAFCQSHPNRCNCVGDADFSSIRTAVRKVAGWTEDGTRIAVAHVFQEYAGIKTGVPSRTLRTLRKKVKLSKK
jgi:hypothetical protein